MTLSRPSLPPQFVFIGNFAEARPAVTPHYIKMACRGTTPHPTTVECGGEEVKARRSEGMKETGEGDREREREVEGQQRKYEY